MKPTRMFALCVFVAVLAGASILIVSRTHTRRLNHIRIHDVRALTALCRASTNIRNTGQLFEAAAANGIQLASPVVLDPSRPSYALVNVFDPTTPQKLLIEETNVRGNRRFYSTMDGSVSMRWSR